MNNYELELPRMRIIDDTVLIDLQMTPLDMLIIRELSSMNIRIPNAVACEVPKHIIDKLGVTRKDVANRAHVLLTTLHHAVNKIDWERVACLTEYALGEATSVKLQDEYNNPEFDHEGEAP